MGDNRSNVCLGLSGVVVRFAFASLLLSSVCFPLTVLAEDDDRLTLINDGTELRNALLQGTMTIELKGSEGAEKGFTVPNPGQEFILKRPTFEEYINDYLGTAESYPYVGVHENWLSTDKYNLTFMGNVSFQDAYYTQKIQSGSNADWITDFTGSVIHNNGDMVFSGTNISFVGNETYAKIDGIGDFPGKAGADLMARGTFYNEKYMATEKDTALLFKNNLVTTGSRGIKDNVIHYYTTNGLGAGLHNAGTADIKGDASFVGNVLDHFYGEETVYSENHGAGLYNAGDITFYKTALFQGNIAQNAYNNRGGGLYNQGKDYSNTGEGETAEIKNPTIHFKGDVVFNQNETISNGFFAYGAGAHNMKGKLIFDGTTVFSGNKTTLLNVDNGTVAAGAGLYSLGEYSVVDFNNAVRFTGNQIVSKSMQSSGNGAGVYLSDGQITFNKLASFTGNTITANRGFSYAEGGALQTLGATAKITFNGDASFVDNKIIGSTFAVGGAIVNYATIQFNASRDGSQILFRGNEARNLIAENTYTSEELNRHNISFIQARGGALYNAEGNTTFGAGTTVTFEANKALSENAKGYGGAVYNDVFANDTGRVNFNGNVYFKNNEATTGGGAIFNKGIMELGGEAYFEGNRAALGGAIYNDAGAQMTISGSKVSFRNNEADLGSNIYNLGTVTIQGVMDTMAINYEPYTDIPYPAGAHTLLDQSGDIYNAGLLNINNSMLQLTGINTRQTTDKTIGTISINDSIVDLGLNTIYTDVFNVNQNSKVITHVGDNSNGKVVAGSNINISGQGTQLQVIVDVDELQKGESKEYQIFKVEADANTPSTTGGEATSTIQGGFAGIAENHLYNITEKAGEKGVYIIERGNSSATNQGNGAGIVAKPVNPYCPSGDCENYNKSASDAWLDGGVIEENDDAQFIRTQLHGLAQVQGFNSQEYQDAINAITPDTSSLITAHANEVTRQISNAIAKRFYSSVERSHYVYNGKIHYKAPRHTSNVWVEGIYGQSEYSGKNKWDMDTMGIAAGIEAKLTKTLKVGAMIAYTTGDGSTSNRDTEIETTAGAVYAEYSPSRFYANAFALYGSSKVKEERSVFSRKVESEFDVNIVAAQAIAGYKLGPVVFGNWVSGVISPEAGFRYVYAKQKEYTDTLGQTIEGTDSHTLTGILGAKYTLGYRLSPSMWMYPELRAALTYDFITPTMDTNVVLLNGASYTYETEEMDRFGVEIGVKMGLEIDKRTEIGLEYEGLFKGDYTNHTGVANVKYHF